MTAFFTDLAEQVPGYVPGSFAAAVSGIPLTPIVLKAPHPGTSERRIAVSEKPCVEQEAVAA